MASAMTVRVWGVRGSIPVPGPSTVRYGGNTPCVTVELGGDKILVLDAGTGIRELGKVLASGQTEIFILLSHMHWDHIQGFPFFDPLYEEDRTIYMFPLHFERYFCCLIEQMDGVHFPVSPQNLPSHCQHITRNGMDFLREHGFAVSRISVNHPGGGYGYRIEKDSRSVVYLTDNELDPPPGHKATDFDEFARFCRGANVLMHDAQYIEKEVPDKRGWGHSSVNQACGLAVAAGVKHLVLFHHDPDRADDELDWIQDEARSWFEKRDYPTRCTAAHEGLRLII